MREQYCFVRVNSLGKFLISLKPMNDRVLSWIREKLMQTRSGFCDMSDEFSEDIPSTILKI